MGKAKVRDIINANITTNGSGEITGAVLNSVLQSMLNDYAQQEEYDALVRRVATAEATLSSAVVKLLDVDEYSKEAMTQANIAMSTAHEAKTAVDRQTTSIAALTNGLGALASSVSILLTKVDTLEQWKESAERRIASLEEMLEGDPLATFNVTAGTAHAEISDKFANPFAQGNKIRLKIKGDGLTTGEPFGLAHFTSSTGSGTFVDINLPRLNEWVEVTVPATGGYFGILIRGEFITESCQVKVYAEKITE